MTLRKLRHILRGCVPALPLLVITLSPAVAIVGASSDGAALAPHVVMVLEHAGSSAGFCSAVVVAQDVVLTAAHCVPKDAEFRIHYPDAGSAPVMLPVSAVARHPEYRADAIKARERSIDLALVHLAQPLPARFQPIALATAAPKPAVGARFTIAGYGVSREGEGASSGTLRQASLTLRAPQSTVLLWADDPSRSGTGACTGDSGAPVIQDGAANVTAIAVWSAGEAGRQCGSLTQSLWLAPQRAWIERVLQAWNAPSPFR